MHYLLSLQTNLANIGFTIAIVLVLLAFILFTRNKINKKDSTINRWLLLAIYIINFILIVTGAFTILIIWKVDFGINIDTFFVDVGAVLKTRIAQIVSTGFTAFLFFFILKATKIVLSNMEKKAGPNQRRKKTVAKLLLSVLRYTVGIVGIIVILAIWGVNVVPALAGLGVLGIVIGLGAQKFINDLINGFFIIFEQHYDVGDTVEIAGFRGIVTDLGLKTTRIQNYKGDIKIVANGQITTLVNHSKNLSLAQVEFSISYKEDIQKAMDLLNLELPKLMDDFAQIVEPPKVTGVIALNSSSVDLKAVCKTLNEQHYAVERAMRKRIKELFDQNQIEIPFPQIVVHQPTSKA